MGVPSGGGRLPGDLAEDVAFVDLHRAGGALAQAACDVKHRVVGAAHRGAPLRLVHPGDQGVSQLQEVAWVHAGTTWGNSRKVQTSGAGQIWNASSFHRRNAAGKLGTS